MLLVGFRSSVRLHQMLHHFRCNLLKVNVGLNRLHENIFLGIVSKSDACIGAPYSMVIRRLHPPAAKPQVVFQKLLSAMFLLVGNNDHCGYDVFLIYLCKMCHVKLCKLPNL